jgi:hypothetical protein
MSLGKEFGALTDKWVVRPTFQDVATRLEEKWAAVLALDPNFVQAMQQVGMSAMTEFMQLLILFCNSAKYRLLLVYRTSPCHYGCKEAHCTEHSDPHCNTFHLLTQANSPAPNSV